MFLLAAAAGAGLHAEVVSGKAMNATTGKPQPSLTINLVQPTQQGMETLGTTVSGADGSFSLNTPNPVTGPILLQATFEGVAYSTLIQPSQPKTGVQAIVFNSSADAKAITVDRHGILLEPVEGKLVVREFVFLNNTGKTSYVDAANGTFRFTAPADASEIKVTLTPPSGMALQRSAEKTKDAAIRKIDFPIRPGQTQIEVEYSTALRDPAEFTGEILHKDGETRFIVPKGMSLEGDGLEAFAPEPQTQSPIYGIKSGSKFKVRLVGRPGPAEPADPDAAAPETKTHRPRIYDRYWWVMGIGLAIMTLMLVIMANRKEAQLPVAAAAEATSQSKSKKSKK